MNYGWIKPRVLAVTESPGINFGAVLELQSVAYWGTGYDLDTGATSDDWMADVTPVTPLRGLGDWDPANGLVEHCRYLRPLTDPDSVDTTEEAEDSVKQPRELV